MNQTKKSRVNVGNINQMVKDELYKSKYIKTGLYVFGGIASFLLLGYVFKIANFTLHNFKNLNATLKR